jgi:multiple sugar transport system substrate-binding protein
MAGADGLSGGRSAAVRRRLLSWPGGLVIGVCVSLLAVALVSAGGRHDPAESGRLVIMSGRDESVNHQRQRLIDSWNAEHPDNQAIIRSLPSSADQQHSTMVANAQAGGGAVDIYNLDITWVPEFAAAHYIRPLDSVPKADFLAGPWETGSYAGHQYAIPFNTDVGLLYYRTDLLDAKSVPKILPPDTSYATQLLGEDPNLQAAYAGQLVDEGLTINAIEAIRSAGGDVVDGKGNVVLDSPAAGDGLRRLARAVKKLPGGRRAELGGTENENTAAFIGCQVALMRNWPVHYGKIAGSAREQPAERPCGDVSRKFAVTELPFPSVLGGQDLAIAADSTKPRAAQQLIDFLTAQESQKSLFTSGGFAPVRDSVLNDSEVKRGQPYANALLAALKSARPRPKTPHYALFSAVFRAAVQYALEHDGALPDRVVPQLADALNGQV